MFRKILRLFSFIFSLPLYFLIGEENAAALSLASNAHEPQQVYNPGAFESNNP